MNRGQFFTVAESLQHTVFDLVAYKGERLLEPSFGRGHLLRLFLEENAYYPIDAYEIDETLAPCVSFSGIESKEQNIQYGDFLAADLQRKYKTIVGNPPYVKTQKGCNLYLQFIRKCWSALEENGELIFIVPSDFIKLTSASKLIEDMMVAGRFTHFVFPQDERLFDGASIDVVIFRYQRSAVVGDARDAHVAFVNGIERQYDVSHGIITFPSASNASSAHKEVRELFDVAVGFVSGKEDVFLNETLGNIEVLQDENKVGKYILVHEFPCEDAAINAYLLENKPALIKRRIRRFTDSNWFEWGALRNRRLVESNMGRQCIYVRTMTRRPHVAFVGCVQYFGGGLLCMIPNDPEMPLDGLEAVVSFLNSQENRQNYTYSGRFKIGHRQLSHLKVPTPTPA